MQILRIGLLAATSFAMGCSSSDERPGLLGQENTGDTVGSAGGGAGGGVTAHPITASDGGTGGTTTATMTSTPDAGGVAAAAGAMASAGAAAGGESGVAPSPSVTPTAEQMDAGTTALTGLLWPIDCVPFETCFDIGYPDIDGDGIAHDCGSPGYEGHEGTDISIDWDQMDQGIDVFAAADGEVLFAFDGKYDRCPDAEHPDCQPAPASSAGNMEGVQVCTELGPYCGTGSGSCFWCFWGGNVIVVRHTGIEGVFATRYDHLRTGSVVVSPGDVVRAGDKIAEVGSAGNSTGPHLHFEVWSTGFYELDEPWVGMCGPNTDDRLWAFDPPWASQ